MAYDENQNPFDSTSIKKGYSAGPTTRKFSSKKKDVDSKNEKSQESTYNEKKSGGK